MFSFTLEDILHALLELSVSYPKVFLKANEMIINPCTQTLYQIVSAG